MSASENEAHTPELALEAEYAAALAAHLESDDEESLARAYHLGRRALASGNGILDLVASHARALAAMAVDAQAGDEAERASAFFEEALTPFEMAFRGYRDANDRLLSLNQDLAQRNAELVRAKEAADAAMRELEQFSASVSHDLRAPLRRVHGFATALADDCGEELDAMARGHLDRILATVAHMGQLIDDMLRLARVARVSLHREPIDLTALAEDVVGRLREGDPDRVVDVRVAPGMVAIGDARLVRQVFENLIGNAWKFTSKNASARIEVGVEDRGEGPVFFVRDDGVGFDPAAAERLFQPFSRLHADAAFEGTGVGLATVERIVRRHGGRIWASSETGRGASFSFTLGDAEEASSSVSETS